MRVTLCSSCHPFYTGQQKFVDTEGRIDKFEKKAKLMEQRKVEAQAIKEAREKRTTKPEVSAEKPSLKELFANSQN